MRKEITNMETLQLDRFRSGVNSNLRLSLIDGSVEPTRSSRTMSHRDVVELMDRVDQRMRPLLESMRKPSPQVNEVGF